MRGLMAAGAALCLALPLTAGEPPPATIVLTDRHAQVAPSRAGCTAVGGGTVDVRQPTPDTAVITVTGAVVATGHPCGSSAVLAFDIDQGFDVVAPPGTRVSVSLEAEVIGLLRGGRTGTEAAESGGYASVCCGGTEVVTAGLPERAAAGGESLSVNDRAAPDDVPVGPGSYTLRARWQLAATHPKGLRGKAASAEFAPPPALDPLWLGGPRDPFHGAVKKDFGLRVTVRVQAEPPDVK